MQKLPCNAKARLVDFGVCHYMVRTAVGCGGVAFIPCSHLVAASASFYGSLDMQVVFKDDSGRLEMFDFGPLGGDVHVNAPGLQCNGNKRRKRSVQGEVRHAQVSSDPPKDA